MLYLIENGAYLKIGFTTNLQSRLKTYKTHNPNFSLLNSKDGIKQDETMLHKLCNQYKYEREWFHNTPEVIEIFNNYESIIFKNWSLTTKILDDFISGIKTLLYNEEIWNIKNQYTYNVKVSSDWIKCFQITDLINKPKYYDYYLYVYNFYTKFVHVRPLEIIKFLYKIKQIDTQEYINYLKSCIPYYRKLQEKDYEEYNELIEEKQSEIIEYKIQQKELNEKYDNLCADLSEQISILSSDEFAIKNK